MSGGAKRPWPTALRRSPGKRRLTVEYGSGERCVLTAEYLRVESPSAEVQGHGAAQKKSVTGKEQVRIAALEPVGNYAVRIRFDDGHDTGIRTCSLRSEEHTSELQSHVNLVCRLLLEKKKKKQTTTQHKTI